MKFRFIIFYAFFSIVFFWPGTLTSEETAINLDSQVERSPREDAPCLGCGIIPCATAGSGTDTIIQASLTSINRSLNFIKAFLLSDIVETFTITGDVSGLAELTLTSFQETWTAIEAIGTLGLDVIESKIDVIDESVFAIESKIDELAVDFQETWTILDAIEAVDFGVIESKVDVIDDSVFEIESKVDELAVDFQETWTLIGDTADTLDGSITSSAILDINATTTLSVIQWLKAIYDKVK